VLPYPRRERAPCESRTPQLRVLALTKYGRQGASSRLRIHQFADPLAERGIHLTVAPMVTDAALQNRYRRGCYTPAAVISAYAARLMQLVRASTFDVALVQNEVLPWFPLRADTIVLRGLPMVVDYDDAAFHRYELHRSAFVRHFFKGRIDGVMRAARTVIAGNQYLADRAHAAGATDVIQIPTVVDTRRYSTRETGERSPGAAPRVVWIGQPTTARYLEMVMPALSKLGQMQPAVLRVVGAQGPAIKGIQIEHCSWSETTEVSDLREADIGIMPLPDEPWERGKCGYKLIQYMACGLPVLASPVGVNPDIVKHGHNGFLCGSDQDWFYYLKLLVADPSLRYRMGQAGRQLVQQRFSTDAVSGHLADVLARAASRAAPFTR
jgi:glycosyltransferase involved in cell wall biosynthesis